MGYTSPVAPCAFRRHSAAIDGCPGLDFMKRKIAAIFAADIAGYSRLVAEDEEETLRRLASYRQVTDDFIARSGAVFSTPPATPFSPNFQAPSKQCVARSTSRRVCAPATWRIPPAVR